MNSIESAFIPYSPQRMPSGEKQSFFFVTYTGDPVSKNKAARKTIRAQASRASASQRIETTAIRRGAKRCQSVSPIKKQRYSPTKIRKPLGDIVNNIVSDPLRMHSLSLQLAVQQPDPFTGFSDWECGIPTLIRENFVKAVLELRRRQIGCDLRSLSLLFAEPSLYNDPLMLSCLELLAASTSNAPGSRPCVSRPLTMSLWQRVFFAVQSALANGDSSWSLAPTLALLAGWELGCGDTQHCEYHLRALSNIMYGDCNPHFSTSLPEEASILCLPARDTRQPMPPGFDFFRTQNLLPSCLMDTVGAFGQSDPCNPVHLTHIRRIGLAAMSCQPSSPSAIQAVRLNDINSRIAIHVRLASAMLSAMAQIDFDQPLPDSSDEMSVWYAETLSLDSETLVGTVYDEILLWSLCIFSAASYGLQAAPQQKSAVERLLKSMDIHSWETLNLALGRYAWTGHLAWRLQLTLPNVLHHLHANL